MSSIDWHLHCYWVVGSFHVCSPPLCVDVFVVLVLGARLALLCPALVPLQVHAMLTSLVRSGAADGEAGVSLTIMISMVDTAHEVSYSETGSTYHNHSSVRYNLCASFSEGSCTCWCLRSTRRRSNTSTLLISRPEWVIVNSRSGTYTTDALFN